MYQDWSEIVCDQRIRRAALEDALQHGKFDEALHLATEEALAAMHLVIWLEEKQHPRPPPRRVESQGAAA